MSTRAARKQVLQSVIAPVKIAPRKAPQVKTIGGHSVRIYGGELWTAQQRQMHSLHHVISYRGSFKPELPAYFIDMYSKPGDVVCDPFGGRGTTALQANIMGRAAVSNDVNPISGIMTSAKTRPVTLEQIAARLDTFKLNIPVYLNGDGRLLAFYHRETLYELINLKNYLLQNDDAVNRFITLIALSRLHGHSDGYFSVYSFPQFSISCRQQERNNAKRGAEPNYRSVKERILKKARLTLKDGLIDEINAHSKRNRIITCDSRVMDIPTGSVDLIVTSPPFLNYVDYVNDNWLKLWFLGMNTDDVKDKIVQTPDLTEWQSFIQESLREMARVLKRGSHAVVEVGDVNYRNKKVNLDELLVELSTGTGLKPKRIFINEQAFTKLSNCYGVANNEKGTNTNRCVVFVKE